MSDAVQRILGMSNGPVRYPVKSTALGVPFSLTLLTLSVIFLSQLMAKEPLEKLGFKDLKETSPKQAAGNTDV